MEVSLVGSLRTQRKPQGMDEGVYPLRCWGTRFCPGPIQPNEGLFAIAVVVDVASALETDGVLR